MGEILRPELSVNVLVKNASKNTRQLCQVLREVEAPRGLLTLNSVEEDSALVKPPGFQPVFMEVASQLPSRSVMAPSTSVSISHQDQMWSTDKVGMNNFSWRKPKRNGTNLQQRQRELRSASYFKMSCIYSYPEPNKCVTSVQHSSPEEPVPVSGVFDRAHPSLADEICQEKSLTTMCYRGKICQDVPK